MRSAANPAAANRTPARAGRIRAMSVWVWVAIVAGAALLVVVAANVVRVLRHPRVGQGPLGAGGRPRAAHGGARRDLDADAPRAPGPHLLALPDPGDARAHPD